MFGITGKITRYRVDIKVKPEYQSRLAALGSQTNQTFSELVNAGLKILCEKSFVSKATNRKLFTYSDAKIIKNQLLKDGPAPVEALASAIQFSLKRTRKTVKQLFQDGELGQEETGAYYVITD